MPLPKNLFLRAWQRLGLWPMLGGSLLMHALLIALLIHFAPTARFNDQLIEVDLRPTTRAPKPKLRPNLLLARLALAPEKPRTRLKVLSRPPVVPTPPKLAPRRHIQTLPTPQPKLQPTPVPPLHPRIQPTVAPVMPTAQPTPAPQTARSFATKPRPPTDTTATPAATMAPAAATPSNNSQPATTPQNGQGAGEGEGAGLGQGSGSGSGQGSGKGSGQGSGQGSGNGAGEGSGQGSGKGEGKGEGNGAGEGRGNGSGQGDGNGSGSDGNGDGDGGSGGGSSGGGGGGGGGGTSGGNGGGPFGIQTGSGPRHIVYVLDISSSMLMRINRARQELRDALKTLQPSESFDIVAFFADIQVFRSALVPATPDSVRQANAFLDGLELQGGTNLEKALLSALSRRDANLIVVITDGVPTQGQTNWKKLTRRIRTVNVHRARIFTIGLVGRDPWGKDRSFEAERLLQQISRDSEGEFKIFPLG